MKKITALVLCILLVASMLTGCFSGTKEFTCQDLTITVPVLMKDVSSKSDFSSFTFALDSSKIAIFGLKEDFSSIPNGADMGVMAYANAVIKANGTKAMAISRSNHDYVYFTYQSETTEGTFEYVAGCFKGEDAFWLVQISSRTADFALETFLGYLDTVKVG